MGCFRPVPVAPAPPFPSDHIQQNPPAQQCDNRVQSDPNSRINSFTTSLTICLTAVIPILGLTYLITVELGNIFHYAQFHVDSISFSPPSISPPTADWTVEVSVRNPAKRHSVIYGDVEVSVWYNAGGEFLAATTVENFSQGPEEETKLTAHPKAALENSVASAIDEDARDGVIGFDLRLRANATYPIRFTARKQYVSYEVVCRDLKVGFSLTAAEWTMLGGSQQCFVKITK